MQSFLLDSASPHRAEVTDNLIRAIHQLPPAASWRVVIKRARKERTTAQNRALFGLAYPLLTKETGFTADELHTAFCRRFFGTVARTVFGETTTVPFRTTTKDQHGEDDTLSAADFSLFYAMVVQVAAEANVSIPDPDPYYHVDRQVEW